MNDLEFYFDYLGIYYYCSCSVLKEGDYMEVPEQADDPGGWDIHTTPVFGEWFFEDTMTDMEVVPCAGMMMIAEAIAEEKYWEFTLNSD